MLEGGYTPGKVKAGLQRLIDSKKLAFMKKSIEKVGEAKFYYLEQYNNSVSKNRIQKKIESTAEWIKKYSETKRTKMLGDHLHDVVKAELR